MQTNQLLFAINEQLDYESDDEDESWMMRFFPGFSLNYKTNIGNLNHVFGGQGNLISEIIKIA